MRGWWIDDPPAAPGGDAMTDTARLRELYAIADGCKFQAVTEHDTRMVDAMQSLWLALPGVFTQLELAERDSVELSLPIRNPPKPW
jgi:hypothetical protein